jgi:hypothetical protein
VRGNFRVVSVELLFYGHQESFHAVHTVIEIFLYGVVSECINTDALVAKSIRTARPPVTIRKEV